MRIHLEKMPEASLWEREVGKSILVSILDAVIKYFDKGSLRRKDFLLVTGQEFCPLWWRGKAAGGRSDGRITWLPRSGKVVKHSPRCSASFLHYTDSPGSLRETRTPTVGQPSHLHWNTHECPPQTRAATWLLGDSEDDFTLDNFCFIFYGSDSSDQNMDDKNNVSGRPASVSCLVSDSAVLKRGSGRPRGLCYCNSLHSCTSWWGFWASVTLCSSLQK